MRETGTRDEGLGTRDEEGAHGVGDLASGFDDLLSGALGVEVPFAGVFEGGGLAGGLGAVLLREEDVVVGAEVEGRSG